MIKIGIFDSGLGGLTVVNAMMTDIKGAEFFYIADTCHAPYGQKTDKQILQYSLDITAYLINNHDIDALVVACNTATSVAINILRDTYPKLIIIGAEPAIKPAIELTLTGKVGVLATLATLRGDKYKKLVNKVLENNNVKLFEQACPGLVEHIEQDTLESKESLALLELWLKPMRDNNVDIIVLGCTHYPLASTVIKALMQREITLIDSGGAIARNVLKNLIKMRHKNLGTVEVYTYYTGDINTRMVRSLVQNTQEIRHIKI